MVSRSDFAGIVGTKKSGLSGIELPEDERKKNKQTLAATFHRGHFPRLVLRCSRISRQEEECRRRCRQFDDPMTLPQRGLSLIGGRGSDLVGERLLFLVVLSQGTENAAKPIGAACWYRMITAGSTSLWSLSFRSPSGSSPLVHSISVTLSGRGVPLLGLFN